MDDIILAERALGSPPWPTLSPFLFCVHHLDDYPAGNAELGPAASLAGRRLGQDFAGIDGWRMYHGRRVPGFPRHPHRGFETVTIAQQGFIDHADSLGATARFGRGDVQWMTAGKGVVHAEMFPLVHLDRGNPTALFQIWLNLPAADKMVEPHFTMMWRETIPRIAMDGVEVTVVAGAIGDRTAPPPPPHSWASRPEAAVQILTIRLAPGARWTLPPAPAGTGRVLYFFEGASMRLSGHALAAGRLVQLRPDAAAALEAGPQACSLLLLGGRPIGEEVVQHGPFVMNSAAEIRQAFRDYQRTGFGGWPWPDDGPVHARDAARFAIHADGRREDADEAGGA